MKKISWIMKSFPYQEPLEGAECLVFGDKVGRWRVWYIEGEFYFPPDIKLNAELVQYFIQL